MTTYNSYEAAKIANPSEDIFTYGNMYQSGNTPCKPSEWWKKCNPADHCMTVEKFLADGHKFVEGDLIINTFGNVNEIRDDEELSNELVTENNNSRYALRAAALEDIPTETPEEKEVLDGIESAGEFEWSGDGLPPVGDIVTIRYNFDSKTVTHTGVVKYASSKYCILDDGDGGEFSYNMCDYIYEKPETPQQRKDRERLEAAYDLYCEWAQGKNYKPFCEFKTADATLAMWLRVVDKTNYRKERPHDTH